MPLRAEGKGTKKGQGKADQTLLGDTPPLKIGRCVSLAFFQCIWFRLSEEYQKLTEDGRSSSHLDGQMHGSTGQITGHPCGGFRLGC